MIILAVFIYFEFIILCLLFFRYLVLVSGLDLAGSADILFPFELLVDWVTGWLGDIGEQKKQALVSRILFAGMCKFLFF